MPSSLISRSLLYRGATAFALSLCLTTVLSCDTTELTLDQAVARISPDVLRAHVGVLSHDSMRGRDTDDIGYERARDYVVGEFHRIGLQPITGDSYLQPFDLLEVVSDQGSRIAVGSAIFESPDVIVSPDWLGEAPELAAEGVFVGHRLVADDAGAAGGVSLAGKIAFLLAGVPEGWADDPEVAMRERAEVELAHRAGALAVVVLNPDASERAWTARANSSRPTRALIDGSTPTPRPAVTIGPAVSRRLLERWTTAEVGSVVIEPRHETRRVRSWNVGGILPGADPTRAEEAVVFTAHLDHVGIGTPNAAGDSIYNGTHDNALGVAKVLAVAEALAGAALPRSVLFLATGAEESGLLGAWHYVNDPVVPLGQTVAAINHDGGLVGGVRTDDVFAWGPEFSTVEEDVDWAARETGMVLSADKRPPFGPAAGLLYRSDHYPFLISGVPVVYLMPGFTVEGDSTRGRSAWEEYLATVHHAQADNFNEAASYESPVALTALSVRLAWRLATANDMPRTHDDAPIAKSRGTPSGYFFASPTNPLVGAWEVVERSYERGDSVWTEHEPGLYVFSERYYSVQEIRESGGPRATFDESTSNAERLGAFDVFHAHTGTYTLDGARLLVTPILAKGPNTMDGSTHEYGLTWDGDALRITRVSAAEDERRVTVLRRVE